MRRVAVLNDYQGVALNLADWAEVRQHASVEVFRAPLNEDEAIRALRDVEVVCVMRERLPMTRRVFEALPALRCVVTTGAANRSIDLAAATERGIVVSATTNGLGRLATAELTWGLILALARNIPQEDRAVRAGQWQTTLGSTLHGRTLGLLGLGGIGRHVARYAKAFGMEVLAWSRNLTEEIALESAATCVSREELFTRSDFVSVHLVLGPETVGLVGRAALAAMKPTAFLVNTSRGPIVDEAALVDGLRRGVIAGAALDTFDVEPLPMDHPYRLLDRLILSPHLGYVTHDVYAAFFRETVRSVLAYLAGEPIRVLNGADTTATPRRYEDPT